MRAILPHKDLYDDLVYLVGEAKGFNKAEGLQIEEVNTAGGATQVQAIVSGSADIACCTGAFSVFAAFAKNGPVRIISSEVIGVPDLLWYVRGDSDIKTMQDLAGKKVGFSSTGSSSDMAVRTLSQLIQTKGGEPLVPVPTGSPPDSFTAVKTGQVDAGWTSWPFFSENMASGEIRTVAEGSQLTPLNEESVRVNFVNSNFMDQHPDLVAAYLRAYKKSLDFMYTNKEEAARIWIESAELKYPLDVVVKSWDYHPKSAHDLVTVKGRDLINKQAVEYKFLSKELTDDQLNTLIIDKFLP